MRRSKSPNGSKSPRNLPSQQVTSPAAYPEHTLAGEHQAPVHLPQAAVVVAAPTRPGLHRSGDGVPVPKPLCLILGGGLIRSRQQWHYVITPLVSENGSMARLPFGMPHIRVDRKSIYSLSLPVQPDLGNLDIPPVRDEDRLQALV